MAGLKYLDYVCEILQVMSQKMLVAKVKEVATEICRPLPLERPVSWRMACLHDRDHVK